jgi:hypothetical protein
MTDEHGHVTTTTGEVCTDADGDPLPIIPTITVLMDGSSVQLDGIEASSNSGTFTRDLSTSIYAFEPGSATSHTFTATISVSKAEIQNGCISPTTGSDVLNNLSLDALGVQ